MKRFLLRCKEKGFTLLELLTVVAIIIVLAGLILAGMGYAQQKAASERAKAEIAALSLALESYKIDNGDYPRAELKLEDDSWVPVTGTNAGAADVLTGTTYAPTHASYPPASRAMYQALSGEYDLAPGGAIQGKVYFNFKPDMLSITGSSVTSVLDPFGYTYGYSTKGTFNPTFDLWSTGGQTVVGGTGKWIKNW